MNTVLNNLTVLVTRPTLQSKKLCEAINDCGGKALHLPAIEIIPLNDELVFDHAKAILEKAKYAFFVSVNAVWHSLSGIQTALFDKIQCVAVGTSTASALRDCGVTHILHPDGQYSSEGILAMDAFQNLEGVEVVLFCGEGGRELLADELSRRGAHVTQIIVYRRIKPEMDDDFVKQLWSENQIDIIVSTSREGLVNLCQMIPINLRQTLHETLILVINERMTPVAAKLGFKHLPIVAENATDEAIVNALLEWKNQS